MIAPDTNVLVGLLVADDAEQTARARSMSIGIDTPMHRLLSDEIVCLRPHRPEDVDDLYAAVTESSAEVGRWLTWCHAEG